MWKTEVAKRNYSGLPTAVKLGLTEVCWFLPPVRRKMMFNLIPSPMPKSRGPLPELCPRGQNWNLRSDLEERWLWWSEQSKSKEMFEELLWQWHRKKKKKKESFTLSGKLLPTDKTTMSRYLLEFTKVCFPRYQLLTLWASTHILNLEFTRQYYAVLMKYLFSTWEVFSFVFILKAI